MYMYVSVCMGMYMYVYACMYLHTRIPWPILSRSLTPSGLFLVKNWYHANNQPASGLSSHIVMHVSQGHCKHTIEYIKIHTQYIQILAYTC